jgi:ATP-dependent DNA ligase
LLSGVSHSFFHRIFDLQVTSAGEEGLVVKNLASVYKPGRRINWYKLKPEYGNKSAHISELDVVLLAGRNGKASKCMRGQGLSAFLLGVRNDRYGNPDDTYKDEYLCIGTVGTGYSFGELSELRKRLDAIATPWDPNNVPSHLASSKLPRYHRPSVYFPIEKVS